MIYPQSCRSQFSLLQNVSIDLVYLLVISLLISSCEDNQTPSYQFEQVKYQDQKVPLDQKIVNTDASTDASTDATTNTNTDASTDATTTDASSDASVDLLLPDFGPRPDPGSLVTIDLGTSNMPVGFVRAYQSTQESDLLNSQTKTARIGDFVLENDQSKFIIEQSNRSIGPCPYGGNVIDASLKAEGVEDSIGELCLFLNFSQTLKAEQFEIIEDGSMGRAVIAVTGRSQLLDFINLIGFVSSNLPPFLRAGFNLDEILPITITIYYILEPNQNALRVVTAIRNDSNAQIDFPVGHLIDSGGEVGFYQPYLPSKGFGTSGISFDAPDGDLLMVSGFLGHQGSHLYWPDADPKLNMIADNQQANYPYPIAGTSISVAGVSVSLLGTTKILSTLLTNGVQRAQAEGFVHLRPNETATFGHWHVVGGASLNDMMSFVWQKLATQDRPLLNLSGRISLTTSNPNNTADLSGIRVSLWDTDGRLVNQAITRSDGSYQIKALKGNYQIKLWHTAYQASEQQQVTAIQLENDLVKDLSIQPSGMLQISVETSTPALPSNTDPPVMNNQPTPAKVTIICEGPCPNQAGANELDIKQDPLPTQIYRFEYLNTSGQASIPLPAGQYRILVSKGPTWSVWPNLSTDQITEESLNQAQNNPLLLGELITITADQTTTVQAQISEVVPRNGWVSGDFHVHGINSPDSPIPLVKRVLSFIGEGVDVLVSTDHDYITDYAPIVDQLNANLWIKSIVGVELTTFDYGHYNAFPLVYDPLQRNGGAFDWANAEGLGKKPFEIFEWLQSHPNTQVVQANHALGGYFGAIKPDFVKGISTADPKPYRLPETEGLSDGDTGLWAENFTAMELYNGFGEDSVWGLMRAWLTMLSRGFKVTATAVSDTHKINSSQGGGPRTWVYLGDQFTDLVSLNEEHFALAVNAGKVIGSNGPMVEITATQGQSAKIGDTLRIDPAQALEVKVEVRCPSWMSVSTADLFYQLGEDIIPIVGERINREPITPKQTLTLTLIENRQGQKRYEAIFSVSGFSTDGYVLAVVHGGSQLFPITHENQVPFAYTNPILIDIDGNGYQTYPFAHLLNQKQAISGKAQINAIKAKQTRPMTLNDLKQYLPEVIEHELQEH